MVIATTLQIEESRYEPNSVDEIDNEDDDYRIDQFELVSSPNDFNTKTLVDFIDKGVVIIPGFQRNYVWDIKRASRLIESIIVGLPIPQIFLYEQAPNKFLVIDGQQRLMSIYYFAKQRFPRKEKLAELRLLADGRGRVPADLLSDDDYFMDFQLNLPDSQSGRPNRFHRHRYSELDDEYQIQFDLGTIRNVIVHQIRPEGDDAMYEIFNRLNSGGVNLTPQEIRRCMYDSDFYNMLYRINTQERWRQIVGAPIPDIHMKDVEILLRGFAMLMSAESYRPSMVKFLNNFSRKARSFDASLLTRLESLLDSFLSSCASLPSDAFHSSPGRFSPMIFEAVFVAMCSDPYSDKKIVHGTVDIGLLNKLKNDSEFRQATQVKTSDTANVKIRLSRAHDILSLSLGNE